jgi:transcriptional regulator with XRE-family HTH domain
MGERFTVIPNGHVLKDLRCRDGKLQREVENAVGLPALRLSMYENSKPISLEHLRMLASYYRVSPITLTHPNSMETAKRIATNILETFKLDGNRNANY